MQKIKGLLKKINNSIVIILILLILGGGFYWYEVRPTLIKKRCSWFTQMEAGRPAVPELTKEEADRQNARNAVLEKEKTADLNDIFSNIVKYSYPPVSPHPAIPAEPDKEVTREATKNQYDTCLRHHGLK